MIHFTTPDDIAAASDQAVPIEEPPIDFTTLIARCMGNTSFALALLDELAASGKQQVDVLVKNAAGNHPIAVAEVAHSLKGAAAILGAERLRGKAAQVEAASSTSQDTLLEALIADLRCEMDRCLEFIPVLKSKIAPTLIPSQLKKE